MKQCDKAVLRQSIREIEERQIDRRCRDLEEERTKASHVLAVICATTDEMEQLEGVILRATRMKAATGGYYPAEVYRQLVAYARDLHAKRVGVPCIMRTIPSVDVAGLGRSDT